MKVALLLVFIGLTLAEDCPTFTKMGCVKKNTILFHTQVANNRDTSSNVYTGTALDWNNYKQSLSELACECAKKVKDQGGYAFAMGYYGECWMADDKEAFNANLQDTSQQSSKCIAHNYGTCENSNNDHEHCIGDATSQYTYTFPSAAPPVIDGGEGDWSEWSECSATCGDSFQERERICNNPVPANGGKSCNEDDLTETKRCSVPKCPVDGQWAAWEEYGECSVSCGGGSQKRSRTCSNPAPAHGGKACEGQNEQSQQCGTSPCPVDGQWADWEEYEECSASCGGGSQKRSRTCSNPEPAHGGNQCEGQSEQSQVCGTSPCPVDGKWGDWEEYEECSASCGGGSQKRTRTCSNPAPAHGGKECEGQNEQSQDCGTSPCPVNGKWSTYSSYGSCSKSCGGGTQTRTRSCTNPAPQHGGQPCSGSSSSSQACNTHECPINGKWSTYSSYGSCSKSCGSGTQTRTRSCNNPAPQHGGQPCSGSSSSSRACNTHECPIDGKWGSWGGYGSCNRNCGSGTQTRTRSCNNPSPQHGGKTCSGSSSSSRSCNTRSCWSGYHEVRICESSTHNIDCGSGKTIQLSDYFWGRTSKSYCRSGVDWLWSTSCKGGHGRIRNNCQGRRSCNVGANNNWMNDDPCWGTPKYAWIKYRCYG